MINLGLAGQAGVGKDTVADYLVRRYGFVKYSFSDALYDEVVDAFELGDSDLLYDRETKDLPHPLLQYWTCNNKEFQDILFAQANKTEIPYPLDVWYSPRQILQWWGTEYRRAQDPAYWLIKADEWLGEIDRACRYPEQRPQLFVNSSVRYPNEREWIKDFDSNIWHIRRDSVAAVSSHSSEVPLEVQDGERELWNNDSIARLRLGVDLLMTSFAQFVRVEPMLKRPK